MIWVDLLVDRDAVQEAIRLLAASRIIELRAYDRSDLPFEIKGDERLLERLTELDGRLDRFRRYLPDDSRDAARPPALEKTADVLPDLEDRVAQWLTRVGAAVQDLEQAQAAVEEYRVLRECLRALPVADYDLRFFATLSRSSLYRSFVARGKTAAAALFRGDETPALYRAYPLPNDDERSVFVGVAATEHMPELERAAHGAEIRFLRVPGELEGHAPEAIARLDTLIDATVERIAGLRASGVTGRRRRTA